MPNPIYFTTIRYREISGKIPLDYLRHNGIKATVRIYPTKFEITNNNNESIILEISFKDISTVILGKGNVRILSMNKIYVLDFTSPFFEGFKSKISASSRANEFSNELKSLGVKVVKKIL